MGRTLAAIVHQKSRPIARTQSACQATTGGVLFDSGTTHASVRQQARARVMNIRQPAPSVLLMGDPARKAWVDQRYRTGGGAGIGTPICAAGSAIRIPPKGGKRILLCGGCGARNDGETIPNSDCCNTCGAFYDYGEGSQVTHQILKDNVKGNRAGFACGGTDKARGIYGRGSVVTREYSVAPSLPGMEAPARPGTLIRTVQPAPAVKTITVPPRKSYAYSTAELIKKTNIGYDANLAIRSCGRRNGCTGDCSCQCSLCCQANLECSAKNGWSDGVCPGGMTGHGTSCTTGDCGPTTGPCACQSWTYKRRNNQFAANAAVDSDLLTSRIARTTQVANTCNTEGCANPANGSPACDQCCKRNDSLPRTRGQVRRVPQELHRPGRRGLGQL